MHDGEGERRWYQVTEWDKQQVPSSGRPRGTESSWWFFLLLHCGLFRAHSAGWWNTYTLSTARHRKEGCHLQDCVGQSCKPNMPWFMEPSFPGCHLASVWRIHGACLAAVSASCCINSCSKAEGPGCIMELDQIDWKQSRACQQRSHAWLSERDLINPSQT